MKHMKSLQIIIVLMGLAVTACAQTNTPPLPPLPTTVAGWWTAAIVVLIPLIVDGLKRITPLLRSYKKLVPVLAILLGAGCAYLLNWLGKANYSWVDMTAVGGLTVTVRELFNQFVTVPLGPKLKPQE